MSQEHEKIDKHISNWRVPESIGEQAAWERLIEAKSQHKPVRKIDIRRIGQIAAGLAADVLLVFVLAKQYFILKGGQSIVFDQTGTGAPFNINPEQKLNLPDNTYYWENRPLREVLTLICQRENYTLEAADQILRKNFTGPLQLDKPEKAIGILARAMNFDYQLNNNKLQIVEKD